MDEMKVKQFCLKKIYLLANIKYNFICYRGHNLVLLLQILAIACILFDNI